MSAHTRAGTKDQWQSGASGELWPEEDKALCWVEGWMEGRKEEGKEARGGSRAAFHPKPAERKRAEGGRWPEQSLEGF